MEGLRERKVESERISAAGRQERKFSFNGRSLTIKAEPTNAGWAIQVYDDQMKPVFKFSFNISFETQVDFASVQGDLVTYLMDFRRTGSEERKGKAVMPCKRELGGSR